MLAPTAVVFLTNRECPFHCVMCDLWTNTLDEGVPAGAIATQIRSALATLPPARQIKLYNAGSFFDPQAIPPGDDDEIASTIAGFDRVIVESHPAFLRHAYADRCRRFRDAVAGQLEVAIGLETAHAGVLAGLNKQMTLDDFHSAAAFLGGEEIALRAFILLTPPGMPAGESVDWACRSLDFAIDAGATACTIIPTRGQPSRLPDLESAVEYGVGRGRARVFADLWDIDRFFDCGCSPRRAARLAAVNRTQRLPPAVACECPRP